MVCLAPPGFLNGRQTNFAIIKCLPDSGAADSLRLLRQLKLAGRIIYNQGMLAWQIIRQKPDLVLLDSYAEYLSPLWFWPHWFLARIGRIKYAANLHDPVRNYQVGPAWWHKLSVRLAYLPLKFVLVHGKFSGSSPVPDRVHIVQVPQGLYEINGKFENPEEIRRQWGVREGQKVFLAFGYVRNGKNLHLAVQALAQVPEAFLVVVGSVASSNDKPFSFYRELASELGVSERCYFAEGFVADDELGKYFSGADFVLLTYASSFHSQSAVLNVAARARKAVLASASPSPLIESVKKFNLGVTVAPDSLDGVVSGMNDLLRTPPQPQWEDYEELSSWSVNARELLRAAEA